MGKKFNKFIYLLAVLVISFTTVISVDAAGQWKTESGQWAYYVENTKQKNWIKSDGEWYFLDSEGYMQTGWELEGNSWYYLNINGVMQSGWLKEGNNWYYLNTNGVMQTGWLKEGNNWYYLNANGVMETNWLKEDNNWYYLNANGIMQTGWLKDGQNWYYLNTSGVMQTDWLKSGEIWYYLNSSGVMETEWLKLGETWYYLNTSGAMQTGWIEDVETWYYLNSSGAMQNGWTKKEEIVKENKIKFETIHQEDPTIPTGETKISQEGAKGYDKVAFLVTYENGEETKREELSREKVEPIDEVIKIGTQVTKVKEVTVTENKVEFKTIEQQDNTLLAGETKNLQEGVEGFDEVVYSVTYVNGEETEREEITRETTKPISEIIVIGTRVDVEEIVLFPKELELIEGDVYYLSATVLPENATNKELTWSSSDGNIITIDKDGLLEAHNIGEAVISVSDSTGTIVSEIEVIVNALTIDFIDNIVVHLTQNDAFELPKTVQGFMSNGVVNELTIDWSGVIADTSLLGTHEFEGIVEGYDDPVKLLLTVVQYNPQILTNGYSSVTINNVSQSLSLSINNRGTKPVTVDKIEIYEGNRLYTTHTSQTLLNAGISPVIESGDNWGISLTFRFGMFLDGSYVKYYVTVNNTSYEYVNSLERPS